MDRYIPKFMKYKYKPDNKSTHSTEFRKDILEEMIQKKGFTNQKVIEENQSSSTITVYNNNTNEKIVVKIVEDDELGEKEKQWHNLKHYHVLPLSSYEYEPGAKLHLFYSTVPYYTLKDVIAEKSFRNSPDAIQKLIMWFKQAADGMQYIHKSGYQHLNISSKCIAITKDETVKIKDFGHLQHGLKNNNSFGVPSHVCPPETYSSTGRSETGYGEKFDSYCFGMMMLEVFTGSYVQKKLSCPVKSWTEEAYPVIFKALKGHKFKKLVSKQYPKAAKKTDLSNMRHLIASILRVSTGDRPNMKEIFLKLFELTFLKDFLIKPLEDEIWQDMVSYQELKYKIDNMTIKNEHAMVKECSCDSSEVIVTHATDTDLKMPYTHRSFQSFLNSKEKEDKFQKATNEIVVVNPRNANTDVTCSGELEERKSQCCMPDIRKINIDKGMMGDHAKDTESKESVALSFEHEDLSFLQISPRETKIADNTKAEKAKIDNPSPFDADDEKKYSFNTKDEIASHSGLNKSSFMQVSEKFEYNQEFKDLDLTEEAENEKSYVNAKGMEEKQTTTDARKEKTKTIYTVKEVFNKALRWALDEYLYTGVRNNGSFINKLSENLTG